MCLTSALRLVEASPATAMSYLTVVWGLILGYFVFKEVCCARFALLQNSLEWGGVCATCPTNVWTHPVWM